MAGYARLGKMDFQNPVCAAKKSLRIVPCLENIIVHGKVGFDAARFRISPVISKEKSSLVSIETPRSRSFGNDSTEKITKCTKPVITWPLGRLAILLPAGASRPRVIN